MQELVIKEEGFEYVEQGKGEPLVLLHGLFGALSNWNSVLDSFKDNFRVMIPLMPIYRTSSVPPTLEGLTDYINDFITVKNLGKLTLIGNSLGGHIALLLAIKRPEIIKHMILTGSSGLFEAGMGSTFPRRGDYEFIKQKVAYTFFSPDTATKELVDEVFDIVNDRAKLFRIINLARAAQRMNMREQLANIKVPTCLIWGLNDNITPTYVAHEFNALMSDSELHFIDNCGHAAMMEQPLHFNKIVTNYLRTK